MIVDGLFGKEVKILNFFYLYFDLKELLKEIIKYKCDDGVEFNGTLYTSFGYDVAYDGLLLFLMWVYL